MGAWQRHRSRSAAALRERLEELQGNATQASKGFARVNRCVTQEQMHWKKHSWCWNRTHCTYAWQISINIYIILVCQHCWLAYIYIYTYPKQGYSIIEWPRVDCVLQLFRVDRGSSHQQWQLWMCKIFNFYFCCYCQGWCWASSGPSWLNIWCAGLHYTQWWRWMRWQLVKQPKMMMRASFSPMNFINPAADVCTKHSAAAIWKVGRKCQLVPSASSLLSNSTEIS